MGTSVACYNRARRPGAPGNTHAKRKKRSKQTQRHPKTLSPTTSSSVSVDQGLLKAINDLLTAKIEALGMAAHVNAMLPTEKQDGRYRQENT